MSTHEDSLSNLPGIDQTWTDRLICLLPALLALVVGYVAQSQTYLNHDVGWVLNSSERLLSGGTFGHEIVAANPPLIWWLSAGVAGLAHLIGIDPVIMLRVTIVALAALTLVAMNRVLSDRCRPRPRAALLAIVALVVTIGAHRDFAQREHIAVLITLPWLMIVARRLDGIPPTSAYALLAGVSAGIGLAFKPHFFAVALLVWGLQVLRARNLRSVLSWETTGIVLIALGYGLVVWIFARPYVTEVIPLITQVYWGFEYPLIQVIMGKLVIILLAVAAVILTASRGWKSLETILTLAALGFLAAALVQSKGYSYHFYPVLAFSLMAIGTMAFTPAQMPLRMASALMFAGGLVVTGLMAAPSLLFRSGQGALGAQVACLVDMVETNVAPGGGFMALSTHPYPGFPVANYTDRTWLAETNSRLFLPAITRIRALETRGADATRVLTLAEASERAQVLRDLGRGPELVFVDARPFRHAIDSDPIDFVAFYEEDPSFRALWSDYAEMSSCAPGIRAFALKKGN